MCQPPTSAAPEHSLGLSRSRFGDQHREIIDQQLAVQATSIKHRFPARDSLGALEGSRLYEVQDEPPVGPCGPPSWITSGSRRRVIAVISDRGVITPNAPTPSVVML